MSAGYCFHSYVQILPSFNKKYKMISGQTSRESLFDLAVEDQVEARKRSISEQSWYKSTAETLYTFSLVNSFQSINHPSVCILPTLSQEEEDIVRRNNLFCFSTKEQKRAGRSGQIRREQNKQGWLKIGRVDGSQEVKGKRFVGRIPLWEEG